MSGRTDSGPKALLEKLSEQACDPKALEPFWEESLASFPKAPLPFLKPALLREWRAFCGLPEEADPALFSAAAAISDSKELSFLAWHAYRRLYLHTDSGYFKDWPELSASLNEQAGLFYLVIALSMVPLVKESHAGLNVETEVTRDTCRQVFHFAENYRRDHPGHFGLLRRQLYWLRHYTQGKLFRLGRFEYKLEQKPLGVYVFCHRKTGQMQVLAARGLCLDKAGLGAAEGGPDPEGFVAILHLDGQTIAGHPVSGKTGSASREMMSLSLEEWERVAGPGDWFLDLHIPAGGNMTPEVCADSFKRAFAFFDSHFPQTRAEAIICFSWMFNPALEKILPRDSNLVRLLREVFLFPEPRHPRDGFFFLFGEKGESAALSDLPRDTSLQRAVLDYINAGNPWRGGGMLLFRRDLARFGSGVYL